MEVVFLALQTEATRGSVALSIPPKAIVEPKEDHLSIPLALACLQPCHQHSALTVPFQTQFTVPHSEVYLSVACVLERVRSAFTCYIRRPDPGSNAGCLDHRPAGCVILPSRCRVRDNLLSKAYDGAACIRLLVNSMSNQLRPCRKLQ